MGNNHSQGSVTGDGEAVRPISRHHELSSANYAPPRRNSSRSPLDWERWQQSQFQGKQIRRTSSQRGYRPRSASLRRLRSVQRRRFFNKPTSKKTTKLEAENKRLQEEIALLGACARGDLNKVEKLVDSGVDVNSSDQNQMTALHYAAMHTRDNVIKSLISRGAEVDTEDMKAGYSAIHWVVINASQKNNSTDHLDGCLIALTKAGCSVNATDFNCATPLHIAAHKGNIDAVQVLLRLGADPNKVDITGRDCFAVAKSEQMKTYMETLFVMPPKKDQLESRHIYHVLEPPPSIPAPLPTHNSPKLRSNYEEHIYQTLKFDSPPLISSVYRTKPGTPLPRQRHCQYIQYTTESHLYHTLETPTVKIVLRTPAVSSSRKRKSHKN